MSMEGWWGRRRPDPISTPVIRDPAEGTEPPAPLRFFSPPALPDDEALRQAAVDQSGILRPRYNPELDAIVWEAAALFEAPIAAVSIVDHDRQWFAASKGLVATETPRAVSFCAHAILKPGELLVVQDATKDERFEGNPLVLTPPLVRFYAGAPLVDRDGHPLGALCVIHNRPIVRLSQRSLSRLRDLGARASEEIGRSVAE